MRSVTLLMLAGAGRERRRHAAGVTGVTARRAPSNIGNIRPVKCARHCGNKGAGT